MDIYCSLCGVGKKKEREMRFFDRKFHFSDQTRSLRSGIKISYIRWNGIVVFFAVNITNTTFPAKYIQWAISRLYVKTWHYNKMSIEHLIKSVILVIPFQVSWPINSYWSVLCMQAVVHQSYPLKRHHLRSFYNGDQKEHWPLRKSCDPGGWTVSSGRWLLRAGERLYWRGGLYQRWQRELWMPKSSRYQSSWYHP